MKHLLFAAILIASGTQAHAASETCTEALNSMIKLSNEIGGLESYPLFESVTKFDNNAATIGPIELLDEASTLDYNNSLPVAPSMPSKLENIKSKARASIKERKQELAKNKSLFIKECMLP